MQLEDYTRTGAVRRWYMIDGQARCPFDAVDPARIAADDLAAVLARNAAVRASLVNVEAYEAARLLRTGAMPERYEEVTNEDGETARRETAAYKAWRAAEKIVDEASVDVLALAQIRSGQDADGEPLAPEIAPEDTLVLMPPAEAVPAELSDRQFAQVLAIDGIITEDEALAWAARGDLPSALETAIPMLPEGEQFAARMLLSSATIYERAHPLVPVFGQIISGIIGREVDLDSIWRRGAVL